LHGSLFTLATGQPDRLPATVPVPTYPVTIRAGEVYIEVKDRFCHTMARTVFETHAQVSSEQTGAARGAASGGGGGTAELRICGPSRIVDLRRTLASCMAYVLLPE
jgi:hypothetical protein